MKVMINTLLGLILLLSLHLCQQTAVAQSDDSVCSFIAGQFYSFNDTVSCLHSIPFDKQVHQRTMDSISKTIPLYVFKHIAKQSPDPQIILQMDIEEGIKRIAQQQTPFATDYDFHHTLVSLFRQLNDGHTMYYAPACYTNMFFKQPFNLISHDDSTLRQQVIRIASVNEALARYLQEEYGVDDVKQYVGDRIVSIDDQPALESLVQFSNTSIGGYKDIGTRFNMAVGGLFMSRQQNRNEIPVKGTMTYVLERKNDKTLVTVELPWIGTSQVNYTDVNDFRATCMASNDQLDVEQSRHRHQRKMFEIDDESFDTVRSRHFEAIESVVNNNNKDKMKTRVMLDKDSEIKQLLKGEKISYYEIDGSIGVITIADFGPSSIPQFAKDFQTSLYYAKLNKISKMIIDLTNNGGGEECLGYALVKYLYANDFAQNYETLFANSDMIYSNLGLELAKAGAKKIVKDNIWSPEHWRSTNGDEFTDESWYSKSVEYTRGGVSGKYTSFIKENYCSSFFDPFYFDDGSLIKYSPDDILLISNGRCASTCALFSRHLQGSRKVKTVVVGGLSGLPQQIAQVPGGQVYEFDELMDDVVRYDLKASPHAPSALPTKSRFRFTIREAYSWDQGHTDVPLEFHFEGSDFRLPYSEKSAVDPTQIWLDSIKFFDICVGWQTKECSVSNGKGYRKCDAKTGKYDTVCNIVSCNPGYGLVGDTCGICQTGTYNNGSTLPCEACTHKPAHSEFVEPSSLQVDDACPYTCVDGYALTNKNECVAVQQVRVKKGFIVFIYVSTGIFFLAFAVVLLGTLVLQCFIKKKGNTPERTRLL